MGWGARFAGVLVASVVLSACGAGPEGQTLPTTTSASTSEPTSEPSPLPSAPAASSSPDPSHEATSASEVPTAATKHSAKGAEAFVRHWITLANKSFASGKVEEWRSLSLTSCKSCEKRVVAVEKTYKSGGRIQGGRLDIGDVAATPIKDGERTLVLAKVTASRETHLDASGKASSDHAGAELRLVFHLDWRDGAWKVAEIQLGVDE